MASKKRYTPSISLTESQKKFLERKAAKAGMKYTTYIREVALENIPQDEELFSKYDYTQALKDLRSQLLLMGNNINQIARVANTTGNIDPGRVEDVRQQLLDIKYQIMEELP